MGTSERRIPGVNFGKTVELLLERRTLLAAAVSLPIASLATSALAEDLGDSFAGFERELLERRVEELVAREEVLDLMGRYAHRVAHGASIAPLYTDDGAFIARFPGRPVLEVRGRAALDKAFAESHSGDFPLTMVHNIVLDLKNDEGRGVCTDKLVMMQNGIRMLGSGQYRDQLRRENGQWKFVTREITYFHWAPIEGG